jgi:hypothetical protein
MFGWVLISIDTSAKNLMKIGGRYIFQFFHAKEFHISRPQCLLQKKASVLCSTTIFSYYTQA